MPPASSSDRIRRWAERAYGAAQAAAGRAAPLAAPLRPAWRAGSARIRPRLDAARAWLAEPANLRRLGRILLPALVAAGLLLPPISLWTRLTTLGYGKLRPGQDASVAADIDGVYFEARGRSIYRAARVDVSAAGGIPGGVDPLPAGRVQLAPVLSLDIRGPAPREAWISALVDVGPGGQAFVDPYGWDGQAWQWLPFQFDVANRVRVRLPLQRFVPRYVVITQAARGSTAVAAGILPPPAAPPAAIAELPILEMRAYGIETDDGHVVGQRFPIPSRRARVYGIVDNLEGLRVRGDLVNNLLMQRAARQRHRDALVNLVRRDGLAGIVLDYRGVDGMLQTVYADWLGRLSDDVHRVGGEVFVTVPMPRRTTTAWDGSPYAWHLLAPAVDGVRVLLPIDAPSRPTPSTPWSAGHWDRCRATSFSCPCRSRAATASTTPSPSSATATRWRRSLTWRARTRRGASIPAPCRPSSCRPSRRRSSAATRQPGCGGSTTGTPTGASTPSGSTTPPGCGRLSTSPARST